MRSSTKRALSIIFSVLLLMATVFVFTGLIQPEMGEINKLKGIINSKNNVYLTQAKAVEQVSKAVGQVKSASELQEALGIAMPVSPKVKDILSQWYAISKNTNANVQSLDIKISGFVKKSDFPLIKGMGNINVNLGVVGTYAAIKEFLYSLETNSRVVNVGSFEIKPLSGVLSSSPLYSFTTNVETYYQEE
jgi:Tfp pilus assembly protein PilO